MGTCEYCWNFNRTIASGSILDLRLIVHAPKSIRILSLPPRRNARDNSSDSDRVLPAAR